MGAAAGRASDATSQQLDALEIFVVRGLGVRGYKLSGAGNPVVNGTYLRCTESSSGYPMFQHEFQPHLVIVWFGGKWYVAHRDKLEEPEGDYYGVDPDGRLPPLYGWGPEHDGAAPPPCFKVIDEGPASFVVEGAGFEPSNGTYVRDGTHDGSPVYKHGQYLLVRARTNFFKWFIADKDKILESEGDLYSCSQHHDYPPQGDWTVSEDGRDPAPRVYALDGQGARLEYGWHPALGHAQVLQATVVAVVPSLLPLGWEAP